MSKNSLGTIRYRDSAGELHREDGPALIFVDGSHSYYRHGKYHRLNGPACSDVRYNLTKLPWYINGKRINEYDYQRWLIDNGMDIDNLTEEDKLLIELVWNNNR